MILVAVEGIYFKKFIKIMINNGHDYLITARDKDVTLKLLNYYEITYSNRDTGQTNLLGKILYLFKADYIIYKKSKLHTYRLVYFSSNLGTR